MLISQKNKRALRNPWVLGLLVIVLSGVLVNARFVLNVLHHPVRLLDNDYTVLKHNQYDAKWVQQQAERSTLGWHASLNSPDRLANDSLAKGDDARFILMASPAVMQLDLADKDGHPIQDGKVTIKAQWPGNPDFDFDSTLTEVSPGHYKGSLNFKRSGNWDLLIKAASGPSQFDTEQKVFVEISK
jgi:cell division protein FtsL